ncbi:MAG TPA: class I SAM-dependent methyltransferase, partial [Nitrospira sp.]
MPQDSRLGTTELQSLIPLDSLGGWALCAETIDYLMEYIRIQRPSSILEFGSGTSSLALAWVMNRLHGPSDRAYVYSIDQSATYIQKAKDLLARHGLLRHVRFLQADVIDQQIGSVNTTCYHLPAPVLHRFFEGVHPDCVVIDGPAGHNGVRFGTIPLVRNYLSSQASVFLDDGLRDSELDTAEQWELLQYVRWDGMRWSGKGLLCGAVAPAPTEPARLWLEQAHRTIPRRQLFDPVIPNQQSDSIDHAKTDGSHVSSLSVETFAPLDATDQRRSPQQAGHCVFLNTYYPGFLEEHYRRRPDLARTSYSVQHRALQQASFGDSDFYSSGLCEAGWQASDLIINCRPLQQQW